MKIETKFELDDILYYLKDDRIHDFIVREIVVIKKLNKFCVAEEFITYSNNDITINENKLFYEKSDLCNHLEEHGKI